MKIIKRNGVEQNFSPEKIRRVIKLANNSVQGIDRLKSEEDFEQIFNYVIDSLSQFGTVSVETIQDKIRDAFMNFNYFEIANAFIKFREEKRQNKKFTELEDQVISTCNYTNEAVKQDNANKNPRVLAVQRDYIAGAVCKSIGRKVLPKDIVDAHEKGLIHFHDFDYSPAQKMSNCCLVNLKDMLENGFAMNDTPIHKTTQGFKTVCTLASQVTAQIAGQQYGGQTMGWAHIARYVEISRKSITEELVREECLLEDRPFPENYNRSDKPTTIETEYDRYVALCKAQGVQSIKSYKDYVKILNSRLAVEITSGVKTFQYQTITILSSNGQTAFLSMSMNLEDCEEDKQWEEDTKLVFAEVLRQRIKGIPDKHGNLVPVVFPKLLYFLDERNHAPGTENWWLTKLAAESAAKTMAPDFISSKVQKKVKKTNHTWPCMGAVTGSSTVDVLILNPNYTVKKTLSNEAIEAVFNELDKDEYSEEDNFNVLSRFKPFEGFSGIFKISHYLESEDRKSHFVDNFFIGSSKDLGKTFTTYSKIIKKTGDLKVLNKKCVSNSSWGLDPTPDWNEIGDDEVDTDTNLSHWKFEVLEQCSLDRLFIRELYYRNTYKVGNKSAVNSLNESQVPKTPLFNDEVEYSDNSLLRQGYTYSRKLDSSRCFIKVFDQWVPIKRITKNDPNKTFFDLYEIKLSNSTTIKGTEDHPLLTDQGRTLLEDLNKPDTVKKVISSVNLSSVEIQGIKPLGRSEVETYDFEVDGDMFNLDGILSYNCRSFATVYDPEKLEATETIAFGIEYKEKYTVAELYEKSKTENLKYRMFLRTEGYYKGDVNEIDHFEEIEGQVYLICRPKYWGFFNGGVVTINLPHIALESHKNKAEFWRILDQRCELAYRALVERYKSLKDAPSDAAPALRQYGALFRLKSDENWNHFIVGPRCTYSLGYAGLWETQLYMTGKKLTEDQSFANEILNFFNKKHDDWHTRLMNKHDPNSWLNTSTYGTPQENLVGKLSQSLKRDFGFVEGVTDHDYVTNSYHINPAEPIDWATKLVIESKLMDRSTGGAISYVELPNLTKNLEAVEAIIQYMYDTIIYSELNVKQDICYKCDYHGVINLVRDNGKLVWECPVCRNRDTSMMFINRRVCGYVGNAQNSANQSRMADYESRVEHTNVPLS